MEHATARAIGLSSVALALMGAAIWLHDVSIPRVMEAWSLQQTAPITTRDQPRTAIAPHRQARRTSEPTLIPTQAGRMGLRCAGGIAYSTHTASDGATVINADPANRCE